MEMRNIQQSICKVRSSKAITYTDEFKQLFISDNLKGKPPREIFEVCGFDVTVIGIQRVNTSGKRWRVGNQENGVLGLQDTRSQSLGRPHKRELSLEEKYAKLKAQNASLRAESELLEKIRFAERGLNNTATSSKISPYPYHH